ARPGAACRRGSLRTTGRPRRARSRSRSCTHTRCRRSDATSGPSWRERSRVSSLAKLTVAPATSALQAYRQGLVAAQDAGAAPLCAWQHLEVGVALKQHPRAHVALHAGECGAEAVVPPCREGDVFLGVL